MIMHSNDDDIKIFHPRKHEAEGADIAELAALIDLNRSNGNNEKAIALGKRLADITPESFCPEDAKKLENNELFQLRSLMLFAAQIFLHKHMPGAMLSTQAVNAMYNRLEETSEGIFANISDGSSFTFYYLSLRKDVEVPKNIGRNFAMLCDRDDDPELTALGEKVWRMTEEAVYDAIEEAEFEE